MLGAVDSKKGEEGSSWSDRKIRYLSTQIEQRWVTKMAEKTFTEFHLQEV